MSEVLERCNSCNTLLVPSNEVVTSYGDDNKTVKANHICVYKRHDNDWRVLAKVLLRVCPKCGTMLAVF